MQVFSVSKYSKIYFSGSEPLAYDDEISQKRRNFIRFHYNGWHNQYSDIYEKEHRLDEYELEAMLNFYKSKPKRIDPDLLQIPMRRIDNSAKTSIFRGETLRDANSSLFEQMKAAGFKTVIDLAGFNQSYKNNVEKAGLTFFSMPMESYWQNNFFSGAASQDEKRNFIGKFVKFINKMQEGNVYIACEYGSYRTDDAVMLNSFFNAKANKHSRLVRYSSMIDIMKTIYENLTKSDKDKLKWTQEYEQKFLKMLKEAKEFHLRYMI